MAGFQCPQSRLETRRLPSLDYPHLCPSSRPSENYVKAISIGIIACNLELLLDFDRTLYPDLEIIARSSYRIKSDILNEDFAFENPITQIPPKTPSPRMGLLTPFISWRHSLAFLLAPRIRRLLCFYVFEEFEEFGCAPRGLFDDGDAWYSESSSECK
jgi:hypothetical protein